MDSNFQGNEVLLVITIGVVVMLIFAMAFVLFFYFSQKKFQSERMQTQERELEHQQQLLYASIKAQESERERIARELHDEVGSKLNVINLELYQLGKLVDSESMTDLFAVLNTTIESTRQISHNLLPPTLESFGLALALEELCDGYKKAGNITVNFKVVKDDQSPVSQMISLNFFRVAQELLTNGFKHSEATDIELKLWIHRYHIRMTYQDNGKGFESNAPEHQRGLGMLNIESRVRMIRANKTLETSKNKGVYFEMLKQTI